MIILKNNSPTKVRIFLSITMFILLSLGLAIFFIGYKSINKFAIEAGQTATKAEESQYVIRDLTATKKFLDENSNVVDRANQIVAESKSYVYQDQIIYDLSKYATESGISIVNITFSNPITNSLNSTPSSGSSATPNPTSTGTQAPAGIKSITATVTIQNPVPYPSMLKFINLIEQSLFRMKISQIGFSQSNEAGSAGNISSDMLTIEVYIR